MLCAVVEYWRREWRIESIQEQMMLEVGMVVILVFG